MDVRCPQCGTQYAFDPSRVSKNGVSVKCTECGHVFRVFPPGVERSWIVRLVDGSDVEFKELTALQRWIVEGRISRDAEISRNGSTWRILRDIKELEPFFRVTEKAAMWDAVQVEASPSSAGRPSSRAGLREDFLDSESVSSLPVQLTERKDPSTAPTVCDSGPLAPMGVLRPDAEFPSSSGAKAPLDGGETAVAEGRIRTFWVSLAAGVLILTLATAGFFVVAPERASRVLDAFDIPRLPLDPRPPLPSG